RIFARRSCLGSLGLAPTTGATNGASRSCETCVKNRRRSRRFPYGARTTRKSQPLTTANIPSRIRLSDAPDEVSVHTLAYMQAIHLMLSTQEVANLAGVHKLTLIRWLKAGQVPEPSRDWRGWRVFNEREALDVVAFAAGSSIPTNDNEPPVER